MATLRRTFAAAIAAVAFQLAGAPGRADATILEYSFTTCFNGVPSQGVAPYLLLKVNDEVAPGAVRITLSAPGLASPEFVSQVNFNIDPQLNSAALTYSNFQIHTGVLLQPLVFAGNDAYEAGGAGQFDMFMEFSTGGGGQSRRFNVGESFSLDLGGIPGLTANSFSFLSTPGGTFSAKQMVAHFGSFDPVGADGWHSLAEPPPIAPIDRLDTPTRNITFWNVTPEPSTSAIAVILATVALARHRAPRGSISLRM